MNASRTSWAWSGRVSRDSASAIGCVVEEMRVGGPARGSSISMTMATVDRESSLDSEIHSL